MSSTRLYNSIILLTIILLSITIVNADETFYFGQKLNSTLEFPAFKNDFSQCGTCNCNISLNNPNGISLFRNASTAKTGNAILFDLNESSKTITGIYKGTLYCTDGTDSGIAKFSINITPLGKSQGVAQAIIYVIVFMVAIFFFIMCLIGSITIPWKNHTDDRGKVISINNLRYAKILLFVIGYLILIFIFFMADVMARTFLFVNTSALYFNWIFWMLVGGLIIMIPMGLFIAFVSIITNQKYQKAITRGLPMR